MARKPLALDKIASDLDLADLEIVSLRAMARRDPPRGCPMDIEGAQIEPGRWRDHFAAPATGLPTNCPIQALGKEGSNYYFLDTLGAVYVIQAKGSGKGEIDSLFAGRPLFLEWAWPRWVASRKADEPPKVKGFEADESRRELFAACAYKGTFELEDKVRGRGAWRDDDGSLIYHAGDAVWIGGKWQRPGEIGRYIYPARMKLGRPVALYEKEGPGSPGDALLELLRSWSWERGELDALLMLGWAMTAKIGGALDQRPVVYLSGEEGSGKSALQKLLRALMNGALMATANTTQAGIYQRIKQDSVAVLVDESTEAKEDMRGSDKLLELARIAYSGDKMNRGDKDGVGREFAMMSSFMASSIVVPAMDAQDASRMALLVLRTLPKGTPDLALDAAAIELWGLQLLRRLFDWYPRWAELRRIFRHALIEAGHDSRSADTFAPLAAGAHVALHDDFPTPEALKQWQGWLKADQLIETAGKEKTWRRCFMLMLAAQPDALKNTTYKSAGSALLAFRDTDDMPAKTNQTLNAVGLSLGWAAGSVESWDTARLFVPSNHPSLHALFAGTPWGGRLGAPGPWSAVLRQAPKHLWQTGKSERGLDRKASGVFVRLAAMLED